MFIVLRYWDNGGSLKAMGPQTGPEIHDLLQSVVGVLRSYMLYVVKGDVVD